LLLHVSALQHDTPNTDPSTPAASHTGGAGPRVTGIWPIR
jgi:hypothetical protein